MPLRIIRVSLTHDDYSRLTEAYESLKVVTLSSVPSFSNNAINGIIYVETSSKDEYDDFIRRVKEYRGVKSIEPIKYYHCRGKVAAILKTVTRLKGGVTEFMIRNNIFMYSEVMFAGKEYWTMITNLKPSEIIDGLSEITDYVNLVLDLDADNVLSGIIKTGLTRREREILETAYKMGYFNQPRNVNARLIAEKLGINKVTLLHELRNIVRKLIIKELTISKLKININLNI